MDLWGLGDDASEALRLAKLLCFELARAIGFAKSIVDEENSVSESWDSWATTHFEVMDTAVAGPFYPN